jgi:neutral ceramidase
MKILAVCLFVLVGGILPAAWSAEELYAGAAVADITPPVGYRMCGYFSERLSTGTLDPLQAKALVLKQGKVQAALVCCDLAGIPREVSQKVRQRASEKTGIPADHIAIAATHSHTGPLYYGALRKHFHDQAVAKHGSDPYEKVDYPAQLVERLVEAIVQAHSAARPVRLEAGLAEERRLSFNRRFHMKDGSVRFNPGQLNPDIVRVAGPIDPDVGIVKLSGMEDNKALAALTVFAMHLDTLGGTQYSGDYPRYLSDRLQEVLGKQAVSLFGAGTCGDINHVDVTKKDRRKTAQIGNLLADTVVGHLPKLAAATPSLAVRSGKVNAPLQKYSPEQIGRAEKNMSLIGTRELSFLEQVQAYKIMALQLLPSETLPIEVQAFRLSDDLAIVTLPGEVFVELGLAIKRASPFKTTLVIELTNDAPGYIPTRKAFAEGSYETVNSRVQPGGGELMADLAIKLLKELKSP